MVSADPNADSEAYVYCTPYTAHMSDAQIPQASTSISMSSSLHVLGVYSSNLSLPSTASGPWATQPINFWLSPLIFGSV